MKKILKNLLLSTKLKPRLMWFGIGSGIKMLINPSYKTQRIIGMDEREIQKTFKQFSRNSKLFIDIGASDGYYGLIYRKLNKNGLIYLFDGESSFKETQIINFSLNNFPLTKVELFNKYVGSENNDTTITLNDIIKPELNDIILIKIDVEGAEYNVLVGLSKILKNYNCKLIIETHSKKLEEECIKYLLELGYTFKIITKGWYRLIMPESRPIDHNHWLSAQKKI